MTLALNGTPVHGFSSSTTVSATYTAAAGDLVVVCVFLEQARAQAQRNVTGVSGASLTWTKGFSVNNDDGGSKCQFAVFWAYSASGFTSQSITAALDATPDDVNIQIFSVSGLLTSAQTAPLDTNVSLPALGSIVGTATITVNASTDATNTFIVGFWGYTFAGVNPTTGTGFTQIDFANNPGGGAFCCSKLEYQVVSSPQSNLAVKMNSTVGSASAIVAFAIRDSAPVPVIVCPPVRQYTRR